MAGWSCEGGKVARARLGDDDASADAVASDFAINFSWGGAGDCGEGVDLRDVLGSSGVVIGADLFFARNQVAGLSRCGRLRFSSVTGGGSGVVPLICVASSSGLMLSDEARAPANALCGAGGTSTGSLARELFGTFTS